MRNVSAGITLVSCMQISNRFNWDLFTIRFEGRKRPVPLEKGRMHEYKSREPPVNDTHTTLLLLSPMFTISINRGSKGRTERN